MKTLIRLSGKLFGLIFNTHNIAVFMLLLVILVTLASILLPATVPANVPSQVQATPDGTPIAITHTHFDAGDWQVPYPQGWRVVQTSVAGEAIQAVFVSSDDVLTITIGERRRDDAERLLRHEATLARDDAPALILTARHLPNASQAHLAALDAAWDAMQASLSPADTQ